MKRIIVTGGAGFIGSHTSLALLENGYEVIVLDSLSNSSRTSIENVKKIIKEEKNTSEKISFFEVDIRKINEVENIFLRFERDKKPIDSVIHLAGLKSVSESVENPLSYWDTNLIGTYNLVHVMNKYNCRVMVFSSSATVYGLAEKIPIKEDTELKPINPYGTTKLAIELLLENLYSSKNSDWSFINLRYFNPIGAHHSGLIGENPNGIPNNLFPYITQVASKKLNKLKIFGNDWPTSDGTGVRDYIHVMDLAEGHVAALEYLKNKKNKNLALNLGTGKGTSVLELLKEFEVVNNIDIPYEFSPRRRGDLACVIADNSRALELLDWEPKRTIKNMCEDGWKWQNKK
tara:strand:+ start:1531 stop:2568 length:1038 start_codon:yes stop_codon:yes gene_type:complete